jgi:hypothetical protein
MNGKNAENTMIYIDEDKLIPSDLKEVVISEDFEVVKVDKIIVFVDIAIVWVVPDQISDLVELIKYVVLKCVEVKVERVFVLDVKTAEAEEWVVESVLVTVEEWIVGTEIIVVLLVFKVAVNSALVVVALVVVKKA